MIQSVLYFALGFLAAGFLALLVAPTIWRRAVFLTRKRIESAVPLTANEIQAEKDKLRAEHAVSIRKVEIALAKQRDKNTAQATEITRLNDQIKLVTAERSSQIEVNGQLEKTISNNEAKIAEREKTIEDLQFRFSTTSAELAARTGELESLQRLYQELEAQLAQSAERAKQDELQIAKLTTTVADLKGRRQDDQAKVRETRAESRATAELLKNERTRAKELEKKYERAVAEKSDLEEKILRREKELARMRDKKLGEEADAQEMQQRLADSDAERQALEKEVGDLTLALNRIEKVAGDSNVEKTIEDLRAQNSKLQLDAQKLRDQFEMMKQKFAAAKTSGAVAAAASAAPNGKTAAGGDDQLREQLKDLAAQVVHMTALVEGEGGKLDTMFKDFSDGGASGKASLADRIAALKKAAAPTQ